MDYKKVADFIIKEVQEKSTGFQLTIGLDEIILEMGFILDTSDVVEVIKELNEREEVADVAIDRDRNDLIDGFDVALYTYYAPNYASNLEFAVGVCGKCGKLMTEGRILCKECV